MARCQTRDVVILWGCECFTNKIDASRILPSGKCYLFYAGNLYIFYAVEVLRNSIGFWSINCHYFNDLLTMTLKKV